MSFHNSIVTQLITGSAMFLFGSGPVAFLVIDEVGGVIWVVSILFGLAVACTTRDKWWPELSKNKQLVFSIKMLLLYSAIPVLSYFLIDNSDFAASRVERHLLLLGTPFVFLLLWWLGPRIQTVLVIIALNASAFGIYAIGFVWRNSERIYGSTHAIHFGNVGLLLAFASLALFPIARHNALRILAILAAVLGGSASLLSASRGGWVALPILVVIALIMAIRALKLRRSLIFGLIVLSIIPLISFYLAPTVRTRIDSAQKDLAQLSENIPTNAIQVRFLMWEQAWLEICQAPLQGTGFSGYKNRILAAVDSGLLPKHMLSYATEPHNEYLYQWATRGAFGLTVFLICLTAMGWYCFKWLSYGNQAQVLIGYVGLSLVTIVAIGGLTITVIDQRAVIRFLGWILALLMYCIWVVSKGSPVSESLEG